MIDIDKLTFEYVMRDRDGEVDGFSRAIDEVSLKVEQGDFIVILGPNGSGKSTLAKHLNCLLYPTEGTVTVYGMRIPKIR